MFKFDISKMLGNIFALRVIAIAKFNFRGAYEELYSNFSEYPHATISRIERDLVKLEISETGSDQIHWEVWNEFKYRVEVQIITGDIPYGDVVENL